MKSALPKVLAILPALIPSTIIDVVTPLIDLNKSKRLNAKITVETFVRKRDVEWCDIIILCRNIHPNTAGWFNDVLKLDKPYIYDIDDNFFDMPANTPLGKYHRDPSRMKMLKEYIRLAKLVRVYSIPMYDRVKKINNNVEKVAAPVDMRLIKDSNNSGGGKKIKLVYATSRSSDQLAEIFKPALIRIVEAYADQVEVHFLGYNPPEFRKYPNVFFQPMVFDYESYLRTFSSSGYDIGLAPLLNDVFHRSKTNNKFREYGASRIAGIYSNVDVYSTCVTHENTGYLVENKSGAWYDAMLTLIENVDLRSRIQEEAYKFVRENYSQASFESLWDQQIKAILQNPIRRKKSTRVVEKLIADHSRQIFIKTILATIINTIINLMILIKNKAINYLKMYRVLLKIWFKLRYD